MSSISENDKPHALVLLNQWGYERVWVRPNVEAALQTLRTWFALQLVGSKEVVDAVSNWPDPLNTSYEKIMEWVNYKDDRDMRWEILLLPVSLNSDPLQEFIEYDLKHY